MRLNALYGLAALLVAASAFAAEPPAPPRYVYLHQEFVKPSAIKEYEATSREFAALVTRNRDVMPHFNVRAMMSDDFAYTFAMPLSGMGDVDLVSAEFGALAQKTGAAFTDLMKRNNATIDHVREWVLEPLYEGSYRPEQPRLREDEVKFHHLDVYFLLPERETEVEPLAREFKALFAKKAIADGYTLYRTATGPDMPALVASVAARDAADYYAQARANRAQLGAEGEALFARALALARRFETRNVWLRPDLDVPTRP